MSLPPVTDATFDAEVHDQDRPVFVKFTATWCGPCKMSAPLIDSLAEDYADELKFVEVDIDACPGLVEKLAIQGVPQFWIFRGEDVVASIVGPRTRTQFAEIIEGVVEGAAK